MVKNNSKSTIEIIFDPQSVSVHIRGADVADSVWSQIYLLCSAGSENVDILDNVMESPIRVTCHDACDIPMKALSNSLSRSTKSVISKGS